MTTMNTMANPTIEWIGPSRPFTTADLDRMPDDGHRYELIDGVLVVTPSPSVRHQDVVKNLVLLLDRTCPAHLRLALAPLDVDLGLDTRLQPDVLVAPRDQFADNYLPGAPLLAVEVLSPSTRHVDLGLKLSRYQAAGCPSYWVIDPHIPSITVWELEDGAYVEVAAATAADCAVVERPYPVRVVPNDLLR